MSPSQQNRPLDAYLKRTFPVDRRRGRLGRLPPPDEPFVSIWEGWAHEAKTRGAWAVLRERLPQLAFPVREGTSSTDAYRAATLQGTPVEDLSEATGLEPPRPASIELAIHPSPAGRIPVLTIRDRETFVRVLQALVKRNEPVPIPDAQGAVMVSGYNDWERIRDHRRRWEALDPDAREHPTWREAFSALVPHKDRYQDRFLILSDGPYSAVPAAELGLEEDRWRDLSLKIRRDHECAHYFTRRLFDSMENHLLDEVLADWAGLTAATGSYRADWFLRFLGIETVGDGHSPTLRPDGRLEIYRGDPPLPDEDFAELMKLAVRIARGLERLERETPVGTSAGDRGLRLAALASFRLDELARDEAPERIRERETMEAP